MNKFNKEKFEQVAAENGYEVFTAEDIASYYKDGIQKSLNEQMSENEKKEFVADCMSLAKAVLVDGEGKESTVYYRKSQVNWEKAEDGTIMKGVAGVYADTPTNRLLGRVGEAYVPDEEFMKSLEDNAEDSIAKAVRTGRYADTPENRRLHRVGQPYKKRASKGEQEGDESGKKPAGGKGKAEGDDKKPAGKGEKKGGLDEKGSSKSNKNEGQGKKEEKGKEDKSASLPKEMKSLWDEYSKVMKNATFEYEKGRGDEPDTLYVSGNLDGHNVKFSLYGGDNVHFLSSVDGYSDIGDDYEGFETVGELRGMVRAVLDRLDD